jgi:hypothetical protein
MLLSRDQGRSEQSVIPANAGIQRLGNYLKALDSSVRWNDGQRLDQSILGDSGFGKNKSRRTLPAGSLLPAKRA